MAEIIIDGITYEFEGQHKLLQFILDNGKEVPFFCYHPSMSAPANCRQCMVKVGQYVKDRETGEYQLDDQGNREIRWFPKLQTSCTLDMMDGMVVHTQETDELVQRAQKDTLEFILINHPLDCPICDQAGECPLQIQTYKYGPEGSRFEVKKVHKPKRIELGPRVILDAERCINCTRCVRFTDEISKTNQLTITRRGDKNYPITAPGQVFDDPYSMNTVDICPVGALTAADFRFKARVWEMNQTPGLDITNGKGVNVDLWTRDNLVLRVTPRFNPEVNDHWMADQGRDAYRLYNENRISRPSIRVSDAKGTADDGEGQVKTSWSNAVETLMELLQETKASAVLPVGSAHASVEENYALQKFSTLLGLPSPVFTPDVKEGFGDGFLLTDDQAPNTEGCRLLGLEELDASEYKKRFKAAKVVLMLNDDPIGRGVLKSEDVTKPFVVLFGTNHTDTAKSADLLIPATCAAEHTASYVNTEGRIQRTFPAKETHYTNRRLDLEMSEGRLDRYGTTFDNWVTEENRIDCKPVWVSLSECAERLGIDFSYNHAREIMAELSTENPLFDGVTFERMDESRGIVLRKTAITA